MNESGPDLFTYLDHRAWLGDWFAWKQSTNARYSHRAFARAAGLSNPSLLHLVVKGERNITPRTLPGFVRALKLAGDQARHFELLVSLDRARSPDERNAIFDRIRATRGFRAANELQAASFDYLSDWTLPAIRELAGAPHFRHDPTWIAEQLQPRVTEARARRSLELLERLGMVIPDAEGGATQQDVAIVTAHEVWGLAVFNYHRQMLDRAREALETVDAAERHYGAVTVRVPATRIEALKEEVAAFQERVLALCDEDEDGDVVMQLNLQLFPLTRTEPCE